MLKQPKLIDGIILPNYNVATLEMGALVIDGFNPISMLNGDTKSYTVSSGFTYHYIGSGRIEVQLNQPYHLNSMRLLLWDQDARTYSFYIETSLNRIDWEVAVDKRNEQLRSWQKFTFESRAVVFIRIIGTYNTANEVSDFT